MENIIWALGRFRQVRIDPYFLGNLINLRCRKGLTVRCIDT